MRRLIAAVIILILIITVSVTGITNIKKNGEQVEKRIAEIRANPLSADKKAKQFMEFWNKQRETLALFVNHDEIDEIGRVAARMESAERAGNKADVLEAADEILFIMQGIKEDESLSWYTFL